MCNDTESVPLIGEHESGKNPIECHSCLTYLNCARILHSIRHNHDGSIDKDIEIKNGAQFAPRFVADMTLEEHGVYLKRMETFTAYVSFLYSQKVIKERIADPSILKRNSDEFKEALAAQKRAARPKKELRQLTDREKAIKVLTDAGIPEDSATKAIDEQYRAMGKVTS